MMILKIMAMKRTPSLSGLILLEPPKRMLDFTGTNLTRYPDAKKHIVEVVGNENPFG